MGTFVSGSNTAPGSSYTPVSGSDTLLCWIAAATGAGTISGSAQDFGGASLTEVTSQDVGLDLTGSGDPSVNASYLLSPGTSSGTLSLTWAGGTVFNENGYAFTVEGVGSIAGESSGTYTADASPSLTYDAEDGDVVVYWRHHARGGGAVSWSSDPTGFTQRTSINLVTSPARRTFAVWTRDVTSTLTGETASATESASGDGVHGIFVIKAASNNVSVFPTLQTVAVEVSNAFVLASNIPSLITNVEGYIEQTAQLSFGGGGSNTSDATYRDETGELITIRNGSATYDTYTLGSYGSTTGTVSLNFDGSDCEGICDMGGGEFATCSEDGGRYQFNIYDWPTGANATSKQEFTIAANAADTNSGPEGICYDRKNKIFYIVGEGEQASTARRFFRVLRPGVEGRFGDTSTSYAYNDADDADGWSLDDYISEPFDPEVAFASLGSTGATFDLSGIDFDHNTDNVVISSHTGGKIIQVDVTDGTVVSELDVPDLTQMEGVAILPDGELMAMGEADEYQIFEAALVIPASTPTVTATAFNATIETLSPLLVDATLAEATLASFSSGITLSTEVLATAADVTVTEFNATVNASTLVSATSGEVILSTLPADIETLVNVEVGAALGEISVSANAAVVSLGANTNIPASSASVALSAFNAEIFVTEDTQVSATLASVSVNSNNATISIGDAPLPSFLGEGVLMYSKDGAYYILNSNSITIST